MVYPLMANFSTTKWPWWLTFPHIRSVECGKNVRPVPHSVKAKHADVERTVLNKYVSAGADLVDSTLCA